MPNEINITLGILMMVLIASSWYIHFIVKDGLARKILLWGNGLLFSMLFFRVLGYILAELNILDVYGSRIWNQYVIFFIYIIVIGQTWMQRGRSERDESDGHEADRKELKARRKKD